MHSSLHHFCLRVHLHNQDIIYQGGIFDELGCHLGYDISLDSCSTHQLISLGYQFLCSSYCILHPYLLDGSSCLPSSLLLHIIGPWEIWLLLVSVSSACHHWSNMLLPSFVRSLKSNFIMSLGFQNKIWPLASVSRSTAAPSGFPCPVTSITQLDVP